MELISLSNNFDNSFSQITNHLLEFLALIKQSFDRLSIFNAEHALQIDKSRFRYNFDDAIREYRREIEKAFRPKKCIVFGETSAGKSGLLNKILKGEILPSSQGRTSACFIHVRQASKDNEKYFVDQNKKKRIMEMFEKYVTNETNNGLDVDVFMDKWAFDCGDITLIDSPGINVYSDIDKSVVKKCKESNLIILVVDSTLTINKTMKEFIEKHKSQFTKLNILFVLNKWDTIEEKNRKRLQVQHSTDAMKILTSLGHSETEAGERIFFLSSKDQPNSQFYEEYNKEFTKFINKVKFVMEGKQIKLDLVEQIYKFVMEEFEKLKSVVKEMEEKISVIMKDSKKRKENAKSISKDIKKEINSISDKLYNSFIEESLKIVKNELTEKDNINEKEGTGKCETNDISAKSLEEQDKHLEKKEKALSNKTEDEINKELQIRATKIKKLFTEKVYEFMRKIKSSFIDHIKQKDVYLLNRFHTEDNEYFPFKEKPLIISKEDEFTEIIMTIESKKLKAKIGTIAGTTIGLAIAAGIAGAATAILCPIAIPALAIAGIGAGAAAGGSAVGGGVASGIIFKGVKEPFKFIQDNNTKPIQQGFKTFADNLFKCYDEFLTKSNENLLKAFQPLKEEINKLSSDNLKKEKNDFYN